MLHARTPIASRVANENAVGGSVTKLGASTGKPLANKRRGLAFINQNQVNARTPGTARGPGKSRLQGSKRVTLFTPGGAQQAHPAPKAPPKSAKAQPTPSKARPTSHTPKRHSSRSRSKRHEPPPVEFAYPALDEAVEKAAMPCNLDVEKAVLAMRLHGLPDWGTDSEWDSDAPLALPSFAAGAAHFDDEPMPTLDDLVKDPALTLLVPGGGGIGDDNSDNDSIPAGLLDDEDEDELDDDE